jgi:hypothetical protein
MINFTKDELNKILLVLSEIPAKYSFEVLTMINNKVILLRESKAQAEDEA